jgi:hypothetical protein
MLFINRLKDLFHANLVYFVTLVFSMPANGFV